MEVATEVCKTAPIKTGDDHSDYDADFDGEDTEGTPVDGLYRWGDL